MNSLRMGRSLIVAGSVAVGSITLALIVPPDRQGYGFTHNLMTINYSLIMLAVGALAVLQFVAMARAGIVFLGQLIVFLAASMFLTVIIDAFLDHTTSTQTGSGSAALLTRLVALIRPMLSVPEPKPELGWGLWIYDKWSKMKGK